MQAALTATRPTQAFTAARQPAARPSARALAVRASQQPAEAEAQWRVPRRALAALLAAAPLLPAGRALALLPDDDDEELIEKAKANRKARLAAERESELEYKRSGGYVSRADEKSLISVQKAVNGLAQSGAQLEAGNLAAAASAVSAGVAGLRNATEALSSSDAAKGSASALLDSIASLEAAAKAGSSREAKQSFVAAVDGLQKWVGLVGIGSQIKGL